MPKFRKYDIEEYDYICNQPLLLWYKFSLKDKLICIGYKISKGTKYKVWMIRR